MCTIFKKVVVGRESRSWRGYGRSVSAGRRRGELNRWLVQVLEADALDVANIGRAVAAGAEVWRGSVPAGTEATSGGHHAADGGAGRLMLHPESWFYHSRARPTSQKTATAVGGYIYITVTLSLFFFNPETRDLCHLEKHPHIISLQWTCCFV